MMKSLLSLLALVAISQSAHAQSVNLTFTGTEPHQTNSQWQVLVNYNLPAGTYNGLNIELLMPDVTSHPVIQVIGQASSAEWTYALQQVSPTQQKLVWTSANLSTPQAISGQFVVTVKAASVVNIAGVLRSTRSGTPFPFTATLQGSNAGTPFSDTDTATRTVIGSATIQWQYTLSPYGFYNGVFAGGSAMVVRYNLRAYACGNAPIEGWNGSEYGLPFRVNLGANLHFLNAWWGDNNGYWPTSLVTDGSGSVLSTPTAYGQAGHTSGGAITARWNTTMMPGESYCAYTNNFYVDIAYPCTEGPWSFSNPNLQFSVDDPTAPASGTQVNVYSLDFQNNATTLTLPAITGVNSPGFTACGGNAGVIKYWDGAAAPGSQISWSLNVRLPDGASIDTGTLVVDKLPPVTNPQTDHRISKDLRPSMATAQYYWCNLSGEAPAVDYFNQTQLTAYAAANKCQLGAPYLGNVNWSRPPDGMTTVTHFAVTLPATTGGSSSYPAADGLPTTLAVNLYTTIPTSQAADYINCFQITGSINGGTAIGTDLTQEPTAAQGNGPENDPWEDCATKIIPTLACPYPYSSPSWFTTTLAPGDCGYWYFYPWRDSNKLIPLNPSFNVTIPAGVRIENISTVPYAQEQNDGTQVYGTCAGGGSMEAATLLNPEPFPAGVLNSPTTLAIDFGTTATPCSVESSSGYFALNFCVDDQRAWANGDIVSFQVEAMGADNGPADYAAECPATLSSKTQKVDFSLAVPPEMRAFVSAACGEGGGPSFVVEGKNTGGVDLTDATLVFALPDNTTLVSVTPGEAPVGAILEMADSLGGPWTTAGASATANFVRLSLPSGVPLPPVSNNRMVFSVELSTTAPNNTVLSATGTMAANPLSEPAVGEGAFTVGTCVTVTIEKFWDVDSDGDKDAGDLPLSGWLFEVTTELGGLVAQPVTDANGSVTIQLPAGSYDVTEIMPSSPAAETPNWFATTPGGDQQSVTIGVGSAAQTLVFGNECGCPEDTDDNLCTGRHCVYSANAAVDLKDFTCSVEEVLDCDGNACTTQVCDPEVGCTGSSSTDSPCDDQIVYYLPVRHTTDGLVASIRCVVPADNMTAPVCDVENDGSLKLYVGQGEMCSGGGAGGGGGGGGGGGTDL